MVGSHEEYRQLEALRRDKADWANRVAKDAEKYLQTGNMRDAFRNVLQLTQSRPNITIPITSAYGQLLSDRRLILQRWKAYFDNLLNKPVVSPPAELSLAAQNAIPDDSIEVTPQQWTRLSQ